MEEGIWTFFLSPVSLVSGRYDFWLPSAGILTRQPAFFAPRPNYPDDSFHGSQSHHRGAYNSFTIPTRISPAAASRLTSQVKPDIAAPGVNITAPAVNGGYQSVTGTSFATPVASGAAALLMQWGIVNGNDPFLYGEKGKAYLRRRKETAGDCGVSESDGGVWDAVCAGQFAVKR